jgi:uncharacterized protein (TIGR03083 family)
MGNADAVVAALRGGHDSLAGFVTGLSDDDLSRPTGAAQWDVSQVLSHLGSGAEIGKAALETALDGKPNPGTDFNKSVWARWDAAGPRERADWFLDADTALVTLYESIKDRDDLRIDMGFLPAPIDLATAGRFRLSEFTLHHWDVRAGFDPAAVLAPDATTLITPIAEDLAGMVGKPGAIGGEHVTIKVTTTSPDLVRALRIADTVSVSPGNPVSPDGTLTLPAEAWVRLVTGRLGPKYTPASIAADGAADLDTLRQVFPGF